MQPAVYILQFITVTVILFGFTTLLGNLFYVDKSFSYPPDRQSSKALMRIYYVIASAVILPGTGLSANLLWGIADPAKGAMTLINMPVILYLSKYVVRCLNDYTAQRKQGKEPTFHAKDIALPHKMDYWQ